MMTTLVVDLTSRQTAVRIGGDRRGGVRMDDPLMTPDELAAYLRVKTATLRDWRYHRTGPPYTHVGRHVRYRWSDVDEWLRENAVDGAA